GRRLEGYLSGFDSKWAHCSPGHLLVEYTARWAFERGLDLDTRIGDERYKQDWATHSCDTFTWYVATSPRAVPVVLWRLVHKWKVETRTNLSLWRRRFRARDPGHDKAG
ncbi:MAG TPA: GNAT family N-acetyltransferase, partial [Reyranella sp.]|nr:GNAT family N-acetyltransferase [Reyranella sp.]